MARDGARQRIRDCQYRKPSIIMDSKDQRPGTTVAANASRYQVGDGRKRGKGGSKPRITANDEKVLAVLMPQNATDIAVIAGIPYRTTAAILNKPHVQAEIQNRLQGRLKSTIAIKALDIYDDLMRNAESEHVRAQLATDALAQSGVRRTIDRAEQRSAGASVTLNINLNATDASAGVVIDNVDISKT